VSELTDPGTAPTEQTEVNENPPSDAESLPGIEADQQAIPARNIPMLLESLLFVAAEPAPVEQLAQVLDASNEEIEAALAELATTYTDQGRGIRVQRQQDRVQLTSAPETAAYVERFLGLDLSSKLSTAAMETLAVIAYKQPLTRADIEAVRGVSCDGVLRTLVARGLVEPVGRLEQAGRPYLFGTTFTFLQYFGLEDAAALPPLPEGGEISGDVLESMIEEND
jgi:segregation and condensation protein B